MYGLKSFTIYFIPHPINKLLAEICIEMKNNKTHTDNVVFYKTRGSGGVAKVKLLDDK